MAQNKTLMKTIGLLTLLLLLLLHKTSADYKIGVGIADVTGPVAEIVFAGYAKSSQRGCGLHLRQFARAFIVEDDEGKSALFVSVDVGMVGHGLRKEILRLLNKRYGSLYTEQNFILSATHTHGTPGGHVMDLLFDIPSLGFVQEVYDALVSGIVKAIVLAHESKTKGVIYVNSGELLDTNINRSPTSYLLNPEEEREKYKYNVDKEMVQLKFVGAEGKPLGVINWYAVHGTSMNSSNCLVTSDNVGYASILFEKDMNEDGTPTGKGPFVAAFASSNLGDVSPNIKGPKCINSGKSCDDVSSSCDGQAKLCIASGPGDDMFESTEIIAQRLYRKAKELWARGDQEEVIGGVKFGHQFVNVSSQVVDYQLTNGSVIQVKGCLSAMGYSFAAGTTDGPGEFDFKQGTVTSNTFWNAVRDFIAPPTKEDIRCHYPKPILLATGRIKQPYQWQPQIVPIQVAIVGSFVIAAVPGEFTTMAGRRLRNTIKESVIENGGAANTKVVIAGLSNIYSDYIVTPEEYQLQRYEAASTIYGPHTLTIYLHLYKELTTAILKNYSLETDVAPQDLSAKLFSFVPPVLFDLPGWRKEFGDCTKQPPQTARIGDVVTAKFVAGHPRNNVMHNKTFLAIEKLVGNDEWLLKLTDADWDTKFIWERKSSLAASSEATVVWKIGEDTERGKYRIRHFGHYKYIFGGIFPYEGISDSFEVV